MYVFISFGYITRSGIAGANTKSIFNILRIAKLFSKVAAPFIFPPVVYEDFNFRTFCQHLLFFEVLIVVILLGIKWHLTVVLILFT